MLNARRSILLKVSKFIQEKHEALLLMNIFRNEGDHFMPINDEKITLYCFHVKKKHYIFKYL